MKPWSHSALTSFEQCPKRYWHLNVAKDYAEPPSEALNWGSEVHKAMERRLKKGTPLPMGMAHYEELIYPLIGLPGELLVEQKLALDADLKPAEWYGDSVWCRVVVDAAFIKEPRAILIDWKTGKRKEDDDQLALMAATMFAINPRLDTIHSAFCWLQEKPANAIARSSFRRDEIPELWNRFLPRVSVFQSAHQRTEFPPNPGGLCRRFCPVRSCPYHGG